MSPIDPTNFKPQGKPTNEQMLAVWNAMPDQSTGKLAEKLTSMGYQISKSTCARAKLAGFAGARHVKVKAAKPTTEGIGPVEALKEHAKKMIGTELPQRELDLVEKDLAELRDKEKSVLKEMLERERLVTNIMLERFTQRNAPALVLIPKDSAALVVAMTDAVESSSLSTIPAAKFNGADGMIDVTPNPVASSIDSFQRKRLAG